ncbi:MAG: putative Acyl-CoA dehydrogenase, short-chain specific [Aeromicrobium sp.]|nr:putative Acyl-CoA dehydrogenase, short-chain specific [Aeromicrobium sp.]
MSGQALDAGTRQVVADSLRQLFAGGAAPRQIVDSVAELGWDEIVEADPAAASTLLFTAQGAALASTPLLDDVILAELSPALPDAGGVRAVLFPVLPGSATGTTSGVVLGDLDGVSEVVVPVSSAEGTDLYLVDPSVLTTAPAQAYDRDTCWLTAELALPPSPAATNVGAAWEMAVAAGRLALAAEINGVCQAALDLAVAHTSAREQYGRPLASFQAVRHALAEAHAATEASRVTLNAVWASDDDRAWGAKVAKLRAGDTQAVVMRRTVQVLGAMGLTLESDMHRHVTRAAALDHLLGGHAELAEDIGKALLAGAAAPPIAAI